MDYCKLDLIYECLSIVSHSYDDIGLTKLTDNRNRELLGEGVFSFSHNSFSPSSGCTLELFSHVTAVWSSNSEPNTQSVYLHT